MSDVLVRRYQHQKELSGGVVCRPTLAIEDVLIDLSFLLIMGILGKNR